jgi:hypothetical protein
VRSGSYWKKVVLLAILLGSGYVIAMSFWCSAAGKGFQKRQLDRDLAYHEALDNLQALHAELAQDGVRHPQKDPRFQRAEQGVAGLAEKLHEESHHDFTGSDAMLRTALFGSLGMVCFLTGAGLFRWRALHPHAFPF